MITAYSYCKVTVDGKPTVVYNTIVDLSIKERVHYLSAIEIWQATHWSNLTTRYVFVWSKMHDAIGKLDNITI